MKYKELIVTYRPNDPTLWVSMKPNYRQCVTLSMLNEFLDLFQRIDKYGSPSNNHPNDIKYLVVKSEHPDIYSTGGDLLYFAELVKKRDREKLMEYATKCIDLIYWAIYGGKRKITTIASIAGDALGGGFEMALACQYIIAERNTQFSFPETLFGLFPGMGGFALLSRLVGSIEADRAVCTGKRYSAEELANYGAIYSLAETHEAKKETIKFIDARLHNETANQALRELKIQQFHDIYDQLVLNIELWVQSALDLSDYDLRKLQTLVKRQKRKFLVT